MLYANFANLSVPMPMVTALSYTKKARLAEHTNGFVRSLGFEAAEISVRVLVTPSLCCQFDVSYTELLDALKTLELSRKFPAGGVSFGPLRPLPELLFAPTSVHYTTDADALNYEFDIVLSGVQCVPVSTANRAGGAIVEALNLPAVILAVNGSELELKDEITFFELAETPDGCRLGAIIGSDVTLSRLKDWVSRVVDGGEISVKGAIPTRYYVTSASLDDGVLHITGAIFPPKANQTTTFTAHDTTLDVVLKRVCALGGISCDVRVSGAIDYILMQATPIEMIERLQNTAGFLISGSAGKLTFTSVPERSQTYTRLRATDVGDALEVEPVAGCIWRDGAHEFSKLEGDDGTVVSVDACFSSQDERFCAARLRLAKYRSQAVYVTMPVNSRVLHHSPVAIQTRAEVLQGLVDYYEKDYISGVLTMDLHVLPD